MYRVLVCGGRNYSNRAFLWSVLDLVAATRDVCAIQGGANGADRLALDWAIARQVEHRTYKADWNKHGYAAGPIRNKYMFEDSKPHLVLAFPGGRGTANMVALACRAGTLISLTWDYLAGDSSFDRPWSWQEIKQLIVDDYLAYRIEKVKEL